VVTAPLRRPGRARRDQGVATAEYVGTLAVTALVISALLLAISPPQVLSGVRDLVCAVVTQGCDVGPGEATADGPGTSADTGDGDPASSAATGEGPGCDGVGGCGLAVLQQVGSALWNVLRAAWDDVTGIWGLITDPGRLIDAVEYVWNNPLDALRQLVWDDESAEMWRDGDYGGAIGRTIWNVGSWFIPGVNLGKGAGVAGDLGRLGRLGARLSNSLDEIAEIAARAQRAAQNGNLDEAADLAADAQRRADDLADQARRSGCLTAGVAPQVVLAMGPAGSAGAPVPVGATVLAAGCDEAAEAAAEAQRLADEAAAAARKSPLGESGELLGRDRVNDIQRRVDDRTSGLSPADRQRIEELAQDPAKGRATPGSRLEALDVADLERRGDLPGPVRRADERTNPAEDGADYVDGSGKKWDHKTAWSGPDWDAERWVDRLQADDLASGEDIIVNYDGLNQRDLDDLQRVVRERGLDDRFIFTRSP
jgi:hypothetical protein